jgi:predicted transcriptional regulator
MSKGQKKVLIDPEVHKQLKILSAEIGKPMKDIVNDALRQYMKRREKNE